MSTPTPAAEAESWVPVGSCPCGCGGGPWWAGAIAGASQHGKGPAQRSDDHIKALLEIVLTDDPWLDASGVQVSVQQGIVTLAGVVPSRVAKRRAEALAERVGGVRDIRNTLTIAGL